MSGTDCRDVLIIGAGPTGLAAALFLAERGVRARVIDRVGLPSSTSRAQVVNPRSLELLGPSGVAQAMLGEGHPLRGVKFYAGWEGVAELDLAAIHPAAPMLALPQARSEALLIEALARRGLAVERGVTLESLTQDERAVRTVLTHPDGRIETAEAALLLGADGAHSAVRHALGISFGGSSFPEAWPLYDVRLDDPLDADHAHVSLVKDGLIFLLRIEPGLWRVFGNVEEPLARLPPGAVAGDIVWELSFHISHRVAAQEAVGRVALAGDAAHIHSPLAARGMNLGIEDAFVFAACAADALGGDPGRIADYGRLRHAVHKPVVGRIEKLTRLARGRPSLVGLLRSALLPGMTKFPPIAHAMLHLVTGLDHETKLR